MKTRTFFGKVFFALCLFLLLSSDVWSQNNVGIGTTTPDNSAILELYSTSHGFLVPRLTTTQRNAISTPATGLLIYNLDNQRFEYYNGTQWIGVVSSVATVPFNLISTGTNTTATMTVGSGASILLGGGTIESNVFKGTGSVSDVVDLATAEVNGVLPIANGGTGLNTTPTNGQLLIGNGSGYTLSTLTAGNGITISNGSGSITISDANYGNEVEGSGSAGQVAFWNAGNAIAGNNNLYWDNTNSRLGVGTNIPQAKVHIENGELWLFNNGNNTRFVIGDNGTTGQYGWLQWDSNLDLFRIDQSNAPGDGLKLKGNFMTIGNVPVDEPLKVAYGMTELMRVTSTGNVGIGTTTPAEKLDVAGNFRLSGALMPNGQAGTSGQVLVSQGAGNPPIWSSSISSLESDPIWNAAISGSQTITGNWTFSNTISGSISGNAGTATALQTARNFSLSGDVTSPSVSFNGTADVVLSSTIADGAVTSSKILNGTILNEDISASAGIDVSKLSVTQNNIIVGNGSNVGSLLAPGSNGQVLAISGGAPAWVNASGIESDPIWNAAISGNQTITGNWNFTGNFSLYGRQFDNSTPTQGQAYRWDGISNKWVPSDVGSVTSVGLVMPSEFSVTGSPITNNGTFNVNWNSTGANTVLAGPISGTGTPSFRTLTDADIPDNITASNYLPLSGGTMTGVINFAIGQTFPGTITGGGAPPYIPIWNGGSSLTYDTRLQFSSVENALVIQNSLGLLNSGLGSNYIRTNPTQTTAISYYLPTSLTPTNTIATGILQTDASGNLSWLNPNSLSGWSLSGNNLSGGEVLGSTNNQPLVFITNNSERVRISGDGKIGINITTPNALLHQDQGTGNETYHKFTAGTTTGTGTTDGFDIGIDNSGNAQLRQNENLPMIFQTNGTERMRLLANGKLGIGTSTVIDSVLVQTYGDVYIDGDLIVTGNIDPKVVYLQPLASAPSVISKGAIYYDGTNDKLKVYDGSIWSPLVTQSSLQSEVASVAWKTTGNSGLSEANNFIGTTDNVGLKIKTNNSDRVYISSDGKVGVGTTSPNSTFSVEGSVSNKVSIVTTNTTLDETYHTVLANATSNITITLPTASSSNVGRIYVIKNINSGVVTISGSIEGASSMTLYEKQNVELISNGSTWVVTSSYQPVPPIGSIIAWHKDFSNTPALPYGWVECNGQTLNDPGSPYHNQVIPNLNGDPNGANSPGLSEKARMFLRGGTQSGNGENDAFQGHRHSISGNYNIAATCSDSGSDDRRADCTSYGTAVSISIGDPTSDGTNGTPRTASETRPKNMSVVWIMRVK
jgi:hypothetical protein